MGFLLHCIIQNRESRFYVIIFIYFLHNLKEQMYQEMFFDTFLRELLSGCVLKYTNKLKKCKIFNNLNIFLYEIILFNVIAHIYHGQKCVENYRVFTVVIQVNCHLTFLF